MQFTSKKIYIFITHIPFVFHKCIFCLFAVYNCILTKYFSNLFYHLKINLVDFENIFEIKIKLVTYFIHSKLQMVYCHLLKPIAVVRYLFRKKILVEYI